MGQGPLRDPRLRAIEAKLNAGRFDEAQRLLSATPDLPDAEAATIYLSTRLLFQRGRLDQSGVIERLSELLSRVADFPEAERMLNAARAGILEPTPEIFRRVTSAPRSPVIAAAASAAAPTSPRLPAQPSLTARQRAPAPFGRVTTPGQQAIPRAPLVPRFTPRAGTPSYVPATPEPPPLQTRSEAPVAEPAARALPVIPSLEIPRRAPAPSTLPPAPPLAFAAAGSPSRTPERIPSERVELNRAPTLFEINAALDAGHPQRALDLAERAARIDSGPELVVLTARALAALGQGARAQDKLERLLRAPLLEPLVRSASARTLLELGSYELALAQARRAVNDDPEDPVARLTCAWALARMLRRTGDRSFGKEAMPLLLASERRGQGAAAALALSVRAYIDAEIAEPTSALGLAQRALGIEPRQGDAWSALAVASARLGVGAEANHALERVNELDPAGVKDLLGALKRHGFVGHPSDAPTQPPPAQGSEQQSLGNLVVLWGDVETALVRGQREPALRALEMACAERARAFLRRSDSECWRPLASAAAKLFTELPVLRHFAPYDCSVFSIDRLEAALSLIYDAPTSGRADEPLLACVGAYLGESYRQAYGGDWRGAPNALMSASIEGSGLSARPCEAALARLRAALPLAIEAPQRLHPGADPLGNTVPLGQRPPVPWDPAAWPEPAMLRAVGRQLPSSVLGLYCEKQLHQSLDHTPASSGVIDRLVALLAPDKAPPDADAPWAARVAVLLGAYLGECLVDTVGAQWDIDPAPKGPESFRLLLANNLRTSPVARVLDRLAGRRTGALSDYLLRLAHGRLSLPAPP